MDRDDRSEKKSEYKSAARLRDRSRRRMREFVLSFHNWISVFNENSYIKLKNISVFNLLAPFLRFLNTRYDWNIYCYWNLVLWRWDSFESSFTAHLLAGLVGYLSGNMPKPMPFQIDPNACLPNKKGLLAVSWLLSF